MIRHSVIHGWGHHGSTMSAALRKCVAECLDHPFPDVAVNIESHFLDTTITAENCEFDLDIGKELWLNRSRWSRLTREYIDSGKLGVFIDGAKQIYNGNARKGAVVNMLFRDPNRYAKKHRWGGCLCAMTFRGPVSKGGPCCLTVYSRTTYMGYMAMLDGAIAALVAAEIGDPKNIEFRWHLTSMQLHCFKTLPFIFSQPALYAKLQKYARWSKNRKKRPENIPPTWWYTSKWYNKILEAFDTHGTDMLLHEKYGPFKRIKRRWLEHEGHLSKNVPPTLTLDQLDFSKSQEHEEETNQEEE